MKFDTKITVKALISVCLLLIPALILFIFSFFPIQVETYYSLDWYPAISNTMRVMTRSISFSLGDLLYVIVLMVFVVNFLKWVTVGAKKGFSLQFIAAGIVRLTRLLLWIYIIFKLSWGLNYDRMGIAYQLDLNTPAMEKKAITDLTRELMDSLNACRRELKDSSLPAPSIASITREAHRTYQAISVNYPFLNYRNRSVKPSLFSGMGDIIGFTGYFNPFTGEAQVRSDIPRVMLPYISCHEMAHQLGYASESEANFVGYLAASASRDAYFRYSVYLELFSYAQGTELLVYSKEKDYKAFESLIKFNRSYLDTLVKKDRKEIRQFFQKRKNKFSPAFNSMYDQYLKLNKQSAGIDSYDDVIGWLIAYRNKRGKL